MDDRLSTYILGNDPGNGLLPCWAGHLFVFEVNLKSTEWNGILCPSLPVVFNRHFTDQIDAKLFLAVCQTERIGIASIHDMLAWQERFVLQRGMNGCECLVILRCGRHGFHMRDDVWQLCVTGFRHMDFVADPVFITFLARPNFGVFW